VSVTEPATLPVSEPAAAPAPLPWGAPLPWRERIRMAGQFVRFSALGATAFMPLAGAVTAGTPLSARTTAGIAGMGVAYHCYVFVLNDVCDLPIDRTQPRRAGSPLVQGRVRPSTALAFALANVPVAFLLLRLLHAPAAASVALAASFAFGAVYDRWGKRCPWPPLTDLVQGAAWGTLALAGAEAAGGTTSLTVLLLVFFTVYILMTNGIHGSSRDLANDLRHGARTTAIAMGAVPAPGGGIEIPRRLARYALTLQAVLVVLSGVMLYDLAYRGPTAVVESVSWASLSALAVWLLVEAIRRSGERLALMVRGTQHLIVSLGVVIALLGPRMPWAIRLLVVGGYVGPLLTYGWLIEALRGAATPPRDPG
jgi:4-hydroxybenzoate polyprenyltransferase